MTLSRQGYTGLAYTRTQITASGSSKLILRPQSVIVQSVCLEQVSTDTFCGRVMLVLT